MFHFYNYYHSLLLCTITLFYLSTNCVLSVFIKRILELELEFRSTCTPTPTTCQLHVAENSLMLTTYVSPFKANTLTNWNAVSRQIWRGCHTSVDNGHLNQAPPKQSAVCSACIKPAPSAYCQFIWMAAPLA